jgi:hypothetical protein
LSTGHETENLTEEIAEAAEFVELGVYTRVISLHRLLTGIVSLWVSWRYSVIRSARKCVFALDGCC